MKFISNDGKSFSRRLIFLIFSNKELYYVKEKLYFQGGSSVVVPQCYMLLYACVHMVVSGMVTCITAVHYAFSLVLFCILK